ncbi:hypothetical protein BJ875DRAFT_373718 [Amylocarpus encephaloides]|uniref:DUF7726 domain-containing protein n=1 Tax=Amylocarpus encephaloides TaxID=45428 RepID=A0A9P8C6I0_9HELO|nr:hypothetical protein BJ875DRAFT_373718 [Amylocarpus encephaloides]
MGLAADGTSRPPLAEQNPNPFIQSLAPTREKRKADAIDGEDDDDDEFYITENCDQVRRKLRNFIEANEMKLGELQKALGVSGQSFNTFLGQTGPHKGAGTATYPAAFRFFQKRKERGIKEPVKRVKKGEEKKNDFSDIHLEGEAEVAVKVFDSCDEVRKKINAYIKEPNVTRAQFLRDIAKTYPEKKRLQSKVLNDFLGKKGASAGNTSAIFYSSYVFFEKMRIHQGKPKSAHHVEMEKRHPQGFETKRRMDGPIFCMVGDRPYEDKYGNIHRSGRF